MEIQCIKRTKRHKQLKLWTSLKCLQRNVLERETIKWFARLQIKKKKHKNFNWKRKETECVNVHGLLTECATHYLKTKLYSIELHSKVHTMFSLIRYYFFVIFFFLFSLHLQTEYDCLFVFSLHTSVFGIVSERFDEVHQVKQNANQKLHSNYH